MPRPKFYWLRELVVPKSYFGLLASLFFLTMLSTGTSDTPIVRTAIILLAIVLVMSIGVAVSRAKRFAFGMIIGGLVVCSMMVICNLYLVPPMHTQFFKMSSYIAAIIYLGFAAQMIIRDVFSGDVNANRLCGAICFYVMIGLCFSMLFFTIDLRDAGAFKVENFYDNTPRAGHKISVHDRFTLFNYFSFCTLSTLGYGDITPVSQPARTFAWMEALFGQLYLSILVARLVGLHIASTVPANASSSNNTDAGLNKDVNTIASLDTKSES